MHVVGLHLSILTATSAPGWTPAGLLCAAAATMEDLYTSPKLPSAIFWSIMISCGGISHSSKGVKVFISMLEGSKIKSPSLSVSPPIHTTVFCRTCQDDAVVSDSYVMVL